VGGNEGQVKYRESLRKEKIVFSTARVPVDIGGMKAICVGADQRLVVREIPTPEKPVADHIIISMDACAINPGDKLFLGRTLSPDLPLSLYNVWGCFRRGNGGRPRRWGAVELRRKKSCGQVLTKN
jgi:hypothetical protein